MKFKEFIQERYNSSVKILEKIKTADIPLSPSFMETIFGDQETYCFKSIQIDRLESAFKRQHKKNQVSTFFYFKEPEKIFWGAGQRKWKYDYPNEESCVVVMKGNVTLKGTTDLWSFPDSQGRRWININLIKRYHSELTEILSKTQKRVLKNLKKLTLETIDIKIYSQSVDINYKNYPENEIDKDINKLITFYINSMYESLTYYRNDIKKAISVGITQRAHYNEFVCYSYTVERVFLLTTDIESTKNIYPETFKYNLEHKSYQEIEKELKYYQKVSNEI